MPNIAQSLTDLIGHTPLLQLNRYAAAMGVGANIIAKLEYRNPLGSVKDRAAFAMIADAEARGLLAPGAAIVEATSGNTGIGLAFVAAARGYRLILTMPDTMSAERRALLCALGAELVLTPGAAGMRGAVQRAEALAAALPGTFMPRQFENPANPAAHRTTTAQEILADTDGQIAAFVAGVGTGGTITGVGEVLKAAVPGVHIVAVEPADSSVLGGGAPGPHELQGLGAGFVPKIFNSAIIDEIFPVQSEEAFAAARCVAATEGLLIGISSGAILDAATELAKRPAFNGKNIVVIFPDSGERYISGGLYECAN
ncbi:MAG: cysteine synthase A [Clostridiales bacterium]|nr:cysteine synthase A [Clostridiales bacterium]